MKKILLSTLLLIILSLYVSAFTKTEALNETEENMDLPLVDIAIVTEEKYQEEIKYPGLLKTETKLTVRSEVAGKIIDIFVKAGDKVVLNQELVSIGNENGDNGTGISLQNTENIYKVTNSSLKNLELTNLENIKNTGLQSKNSELNLNKIKQYYNDLIQTYENERAKANQQIEKLRILANIANFNYENYLKKGELEKLHSLNQIEQTDSQNESIRTQIETTDDVGDELLDQAEKNLENAEDYLDNARAYLQMLENSNASLSDLRTARESVEKAKAQYDSIENEIERIESNNDATIDNLREQLNTGYTRLQGSEIQNENYLIDIETKLKNLEFEKDLAVQNLKEAEVSLALIESQQKQNLNNVLNDISIAELNVLNLRSSSELTKRQSKLKESEVMIKLTEIDGHLNILKSQNDKRVIGSFLDGIISKKFVEKGTVVSPGTEIVEIIDNNNFSVEWYVPENDASNIKLGKEVFVIFEKIEKPVVAKITSIDPSAGKYSKKVRIEAVLDQKLDEMKDNIYVQVLINNENENPHPTISLSALKTDYKDTFVFVLIDNKAVLKPIKILETLEDKIVIEEGLEAGEVIINNPSKLLQDGMEVISK